MATEIEAAELLIMQAADLKNRHLPVTKQSAMAKYFASEVAVRALTRLCRSSVDMAIPKISR
jgi:alkylation response protein AidB-like acyl-CoA dehydrogenase